MFVSMSMFVSFSHTNLTPPAHTTSCILHPTIYALHCTLRTTQVQESSAVVETTEYEEVTEGTHATATYRSFQRKQRHDRWGHEETLHFFRALRQCGTEFSLMQSFFPGRTRRQLKLKFHREEREHPELVKQTLSCVQPLDETPFNAQFAAHPSEVPVDERDAARARTEGSGPRWQLQPDLPAVFCCDGDVAADMIEV